MLPLLRQTRRQLRPVWRTAGQTLADSLNQHLSLLVLAWLLGLLAMSLRLLGGLLYVQRLRRYRVRPLPSAWQERLAAHGPQPACGGRWRCSNRRWCGCRWW